MNKRQAATKRTVVPSLSPTHLDREAERLLTSLGSAGAYGFPDPTAEHGLIVRQGADGVSLGGGRFSAKAGLALSAAGLAAPQADRPDRLVISAAGRARLARGRASGEVRFLAQHLDLVREPGGEAGTLRDASESPLAWMARRRGRDGAPLIDGAAFEAGERLRRDITRAGMVPAMTAEWGAPRVDGSGPRDSSSATDGMVAARQRVDHALAAVGADMAGLLIDLCGFLKGLEVVERERGWPPRSAKVVVRMALSRLAEHYGLGRAAVGPERSRPRLWRAPETPEESVA